MTASIFGLRCHNALKPLMKNFWLMTMMMMVRSICVSPMATWLPSNHAGSGHPHIM